MNESSDSEMEDRSSARLAHISIDEWLNFKLDREVPFVLLNQHHSVSDEMTHMQLTALRSRAG